MSFADRLAHAWNAFKSDEHSKHVPDGPISSYRPDRSRYISYGAQTIISSIYTRIAIDVASLTFIHARLTKDGRIYEETLKSGLQNCLSVEANIDQSYFDFMMDVVLSLLEEGVIAIVPVDTQFNPNVTGSYDILTMRTGKIMAWSPKYVRVRLYNDNLGVFQDIDVPKRLCAIVENPFHQVMNDDNSTVRRLVHKMALVDSMDDDAASGKLDLIIQLPYVVKSKAREEQAKRRKESIEMQLSGSKHGIAYIDATEHVTQLNRPLGNNLQENAETLLHQLYNQLGMTEAVFDGSASEQIMLNYYNQTISPIATAIVAEMSRKFLTKTARTQRQAIMFLRDPFRLVPVSQLADIADKFTRNEVLSGNEVRSIIGFRPSSDPAANELRNKNMPAPDGEEPMPMEGEYDSPEGGGLEESGPIRSFDDLVNFM